MTEGPKRPAHEVWEALEKEALAEEAERVAKLSDEELDAELAAKGVDAQALRERGADFVAKLLEKQGRQGAVAQAVPQEPPPRVLDARERRRPRPVVFWIAIAAAATVTVAGGVLYATLRRAPAPQAPAPAPTPSSPAPVESASPDLVAAADLRERAAAAYREGHADRCLDLLAQARRKDPAGDTTPAVQDLRRRAIAALSGKPLKPTR